MSESSVDIIRKIYELGAKGEMGGMMSLLDPEIIVHEANGLPYGGEYRGLAGMGQLMQKLNEVVEGFSAKAEQFFVSGDDVAALLRVKGRGRLTGLAIDMAVMEVWTVKNGRATSIRPFYWDTAEFARLTKGEASA